MKSASARRPADPLAINRETYTKSRVVRSYSGFTQLYPAERRIFAEYERQFSGAVLDLAIGTGRTTAALLPRASSYVGLDYSPAMLAAARQAFPRAELYCADMRAVPRLFRERRFDAILISFNGIDYISWEDRNELLRGLRRLLRPRGILVFSTHDLQQAEHARGFRVRSDLRPRWSQLRSDPLGWCAKLVKMPIWALLAWCTHKRNSRSEQLFSGYAYLNDSGENFGLVTVYVAPEVQLEVLTKSGYRTMARLPPWLDARADVFSYFVCTPDRGMPGA